jgi:glycyl-tRNA synthetase
MDDLVKLCKHKGFIFQSSEIYGPMAGFYDYGPLGVEMKNNIKKLWWREMVQRREDVVGLDSSIIASPLIWQASGHVGGFADPMVDCRASNVRYRADQVFFAALVHKETKEIVTYVTVLESETMMEEATKMALKTAKSLGKAGPFLPLQLQDLTTAPAELFPLLPSPATGLPGSLTTPRDFNLMFQTNVGALQEESSVSYLRPETAQGIFTNFANVQRTARTKIPFGIAQIGKAFRNEITPRNFIFRSREFEQMEIEYFIPPGDDVWPQFYQQWIDLYWQWLVSIGVEPQRMHKKEHASDKLAHYARACTDITFDFPFGEQQELMGVAARGNFDLTQHANASGKNLEYVDPVTHERYLPHCIEPSIGIDRLFLALLTSAYCEEVVDEAKKDTRVVLKLHPSIAPVKAAVFPLVSNKPELVSVAKDLYRQLQQRYNVEFDTSGAIGRRYRRQDENGTPFCVTVDFESLQDRSVTLRLRDSMEQVRIKMDEVPAYLSKAIDGF